MPGSLLLLFAAIPFQGPPEVPPRLTVILSIDQMRADFPGRMAPYWTGGLARIFAEGVRFKDAVVDHAASETGPGHAALGTGTWPSTNGIVGNRWWDPGLGRIRYCVEGGTTEALMAPTLGTRLKAAADGALVVGLAGKDRSALLMAGGDADLALWWDKADGLFHGPPGARAVPWTAPWTQESPTARFAGTTWEAVATERAVSGSGTREDDYPGEAMPLGRTFPYVFPEDGTNLGLAVRASPRLDQMVLELGRASIKGMGLGADEIPDLLFLGLSSTDLVGHMAGPFSREALENQLELDRLLDSFLAYLDQEVGAGQWALVLTSDHGVAMLPEWSSSLGGPGRRALVERRQAFRALKDSGDLLDPGALKQGIVRIDRKAAAGAPQGLVEATHAAVRALESHPAVAAAYVAAEIRTAAPGFAGLFARSAFPGRSPDVFIRWREGDIQMLTGTSHGSPYEYDRRVPLVFMGPGIASGTADGFASTACVAPTLAGWLGLDLDGFDGVPLWDRMAGRGGD